MKHVKRADRQRDWATLGTATGSRAVEKAGRGGGRNRLKPVLDRLEDRQLLATFTVTNNSDLFNGDGTPSNGTLRWAVEQADLVNGPSTINFNLATPALITLQKVDQTLEISKPITITGPGASSLTVSGNKVSGVFQIESGVTASISGLAITQAFAGYGAWTIWAR